MLRSEFLPETKPAYDALVVDDQGAYSRSNLYATCYGNPYLYHIPVCFDADLQDE